MSVVNEGERTALEEMGEAVNPKIKVFFPHEKPKQTSSGWVVMRPLPTLTYPKSLNHMILLE